MTSRQAILPFLALLRESPVDLKTSISGVSSDLSSQMRRSFAYAGQCDLRSSIYLKMSLDMTLIEGVRTNLFTISAPLLEKIRLRGR